MYNSILFQWISVISFFEFLIVIACTRHFKGHLEILASTIYQESHYLENHYQQWHRHYKNFIFLLEIFFGKTIYIWYTSIFFLLFSYSASISLSNNYSFPFPTQFPTHQFRDIYWCSRQKDNWIFKNTNPLAFWKT